MTDPKKFHLRITAGPSYDASAHTLVQVNTSHPTPITSSHINAQLYVRIQNFRGLPTSSPHTSPYFSDHAHVHDLYSIAFRFTLPESIPGDKLLFGNDFERPIRDRLPTGFGAALRFVKWSIDPGLDGDVYSDNPHLYGPLLSSINVLRVGESVGAGHEGITASEGDEKAEVAEEDLVWREGGEGDGVKAREEHAVPEGASQRMKFFLDAHKKQDWVFEGGREYLCDFFNPYLDFNDLSLKLPVMSLPLMRFWDGQPLRYVLKHRDEDKQIDQELIVVVITLVPEEELQEEEGKSQDAKTTSNSKTQGADTSNTQKQGTYEDEGVD